MLVLHIFIIDGHLSDSVWVATEFTELFVDYVTGNVGPAGTSTRTKILWDEEYLYFAFEVGDVILRGQCVAAFSCYISFELRAGKGQKLVFGNPIEIAVLREKEIKQM